MAGRFSQVIALLQTRAALTAFFGEVAVFRVRAPCDLRPSLGRLPFHSMLLIPCRWRQSAQPSARVRGCVYVVASLFA